MKSTKLKPKEMYELKGLLVKLAFNESMSAKEFFASAKLGGISKKKANWLLKKLWEQGDIYFPRKGLVEGL